MTLEIQTNAVKARDKTPEGVQDQAGESSSGDKAGELKLPDSLLE